MTNYEKLIQPKSFEQVVSEVYKNDNLMNKICLESSVNGLCRYCESEEFTILPENCKTCVIEWLQKECKE